MKTVKTNTMRLGALMGVLEQLAIGLSSFSVYALILRSLGTEDLGIWSLALTATAIYGYFSFPNGITLFRHLSYAQSCGDPHRSAAILETSVAIVSCTYAGICLIGYFPFLWFMHSIAPATRQETISTIIPIVFASIFITNVANVFGYALGSLHKMHVRSAINIFGIVVMIAVTLYFFKTHGIVAAALGTLCQQTSMLLLYFLFVKREMPNARLLTPRIDLSAARAIVASSAQLQVMTLSLALREPFTRLVLGFFGTLDSISLFTVAWRIVLLPRGFVNSAILPVAPAFAAIPVREGRERLQWLAFGVVFGAMPMAIAATIGSAPIASELLFGHYRPDFLIYTVIVSLAMLLEAISIVPYLRSIGEDRLSRSLYGHLLMGGINVVAGTIGAMMFGAIGAVVGLAIALIVGAIFMTLGNIWMLGGHLRDFDASKHFLALACSAVAAPACLGVYTQFRASLGFWITAALMAAVGAAIVTLPAVRLARSLRLIRRSGNSNVDPTGES